MNIFGNKFYMKQVQSKSNKQYKTKKHNKHQEEGIKVSQP